MNVVSVKNVLKKNIFNTWVLVNAIAVATLLFFYAFVFSFILPEGINNVFATRLFKLFLKPLAALYFVFIGYFFYTKQKVVGYIKPAEGFDARDLFLLFLPMTPIVRYIILNLNILSAFGVIAVLAVFLAVSFVLVLMIPALLSKIASKKVLMMVGLSFSYLLFNMASLASDSHWHLAGSLRIQISVLAAVFILTLVIYSKDKKYFNMAVIAFFVVITLTNINPPEEIRSTNDRPQMYALTEGKELIAKPDVFFLTYDSYVENETMLQYGIDNNVQEDYLIENGFHIYKGTYSLGAASLSSMERVLNVQFYPKDFYKAVAGNGSVQNILRDNGYETAGVFFSDYFFRSSSPSYDYSFPMEISPAAVVAPYGLLSKQILEGEFRFDAGFENITYSEYLSEKRNVLASKSNKPIFLYTHSKFPGHSQNSGRALGDEVEIYKEDLIEANKEMRIDIETIKQHNPSAIVIVCGDHGPYLTKNCTTLNHSNGYDISEIDRLDIQDRYGSFLAIKWPKNANIAHDKIAILQDIFPSVFAYLYDDASVLNSRIEQLTLDEGTVGGVRVRNGIIEGGIDDGRSLFDSTKER